MATTRQKALDIAGKMLPPDLVQLLTPDNRAAFGAELEEVIYHASGYAGFPAAASARDVVREALKKAGMLS